VTATAAPASSVNQAAQSIAANCEDVQIAAAVEHMHPFHGDRPFDPSPASSTSNIPANHEHGR